MVALPDMIRDTIVRSQRGGRSSYGEAALDDECRKVASAATGTRNTVLNTAAFSLAQLVASGDLDEGLVRGRLEGAAIGAGLGKDEIRATLDSGFQAGVNHPRIQMGGGEAWVHVAGQSAAAGEPPTKRLIVAAPFAYRDPATMPSRDWLQGTHLIRRFVSGTFAPGGLGKSALVQAELLSLVSGRDFLGVGTHYPSLTCWYWNLEDPLEEIERRFRAAAQLHGIDLRAIAREGRLLVNSGRDMPLVVARVGRDGIQVTVPVVDALLEEITRRAIDVLRIDPFVSSHAVPENDNSAMDTVVKLWGQIAERGKCAVELVHHTKKMGGEGMSLESARGGSALVDGLRSGRVLHPMSNEDAAQLGVERERRRYFFTMPEKQSMAPPAGERTWFRLASVQLANGDNVQAVESWAPPDPFEDVTAADLAKVQAMFRLREYRTSDQAAEWGGYAVAQVLKLDAGQGLKANERNPAQRANRGRIKRILQCWRDNGAIGEETRRDNKRMARSFFIALRDDEG